jgi:hypothetical protein
VLLLPDMTLIHHRDISKMVHYATNGVSRLTLNSAGTTYSSSVTANSLAITTAPITSSGTPPILTRNATTGSESVLYSTF